MKKIVMCAFIFLLGANSFGQHIDTAAASRRTALLVKSKSQKSGGWVLLGTGSALVLGGLILGNRKESSFDDAGTGFVMGGLGILSAIGSIPLFMASGRNKRAAARTVSLKIQRANEMPTAAAPQYFAQLSFKFSF